MFDLSILFSLLISSIFLGEKLSVFQKDYYIGMENEAFHHCIGSFCGHPSRNLKVSKDWIMGGVLERDLSNSPSFTRKCCQNQQRWAFKLWLNHHVVWKEKLYRSVMKPQRLHSR